MFSFNLDRQTFSTKVWWWQTNSGFPPPRSYFCIFLIRFHVILLTYFKSDYCLDFCDISGHHVSAYCQIATRNQERTLQSCKSQKNHQLNIVIWCYSRLNLFVCFMDWMIMVHLLLTSNPQDLCPLREEYAQGVWSFSCGTIQLVGSIYTDLDVCVFPFQLDNCNRFVAVILFLSLVCLKSIHLVGSCW